MYSKVTLPGRRLHESLLYHGRNVLCGLRRERPLQLTGDRAFVSFTFDDFPASALEHGGGVLERYGARGTFYCSGTFLQAEHPSMVTSRHLQAAVARGHEVGCHSFSHLDCAGAHPAAMEQDLAHNATILSRVLPSTSSSLDHFAYPYGKVTPTARRVVARRFCTGRGIYRGINQGRADAALLKANPLYGPDAIYRKAVALIHAVACAGGWLIFFTHDVSDQPSSFGARSVALEHVVRTAHEAGCLLLPVGEVAKALGLPRRDAYA